MAPLSTACEARHFKVLPKMHRIVQLLNATKASLLEINSALAKRLVEEHVQKLATHFERIQEDYAAYCDARTFARDKTDAVTRALRTLRDNMSRLVERTVVSASPASEAVLTFDAAKAIMHSTFDVYIRRGDSLAQVCNDLSVQFAQIVVDVQTDLETIREHMQDVLVLDRRSERGQLVRSFS